MSAIVFMDTETTGLSLDDDIWEFAAIRREEDGTERELHLFIEHDRAKCFKLPKPFLEDHRSRYIAEEAVPSMVAVARISEFLHGKACGAPKPHLVGAVPNFDTERVYRLIRRHEYRLDAPWHYHLIDVENLAVGYLAGRARSSFGSKPLPIPSLPWDSDALSQAVGVDPGRFERHTAMGDARWAMALYDAVIGSAQ